MVALPRLSPYSVSMRLFAAIIGFLVSIGAYFYYNNYAANPSPADTQVETATNSPSMPALTTVNRSGQNIAQMPQDILAMKNLQHLDLSNTTLSGSLPGEIRHLSNLEVLNVSNNRMTGLPAEIGQLSMLRILNAANNQLTGIPHELGNLQNLEVLDLSGNDISEPDLNEIRKKLPASTRIIL